jgi:hypothetical protein
MMGDRLNYPGCQFELKDITKSFFEEEDFFAIMGP